MAHKQTLVFSSEGSFIYRLLHVQINFCQIRTRIRSFVQLTDIVQYNYITVYNVILIDKVYNNIIIIILGELYQLSFCKSRFNHNNSHFNTLSRHKMHLMYVNTLFVHKLETRITYIRCLLCRERVLN